MCKYCDFKYREKPFCKKKILRGKLLLDDCDVCIYIEKVDCGKYGIEFDLNSDSYDSYDGSTGIEYCPICGRKLERSK